MLRGTWANGTGGKLVTTHDVHGAVFLDAQGEIPEGLRSLRLVRETIQCPRISVVIPALNEARNLPHVLGALPKDIYEVILVDGHSDDGTMEVAKELYPEIRLVRQSRRGKGEALAAGFAACRGDIIVML